MRLDKQAAVEYVGKLSPVDPSDPYIDQLRECVHCDQAGTKDRPLLRESMDCDDLDIPVAVHADCHIAARTGGHEGLRAFVADQIIPVGVHEEDPSVRAMLEKFGREISNVKRPGEEQP
jgi:hypothetical protein